MSSGGSAKVEFTGDVTKLVEALGRVEVKIGGVEKALAKTGATSKATGDAIKSIGDKGKKATEEVSDGSAKMLKNFAASVLSVQALKAALEGLYDVQKRENDRLKNEGATVIHTLSATGDLASAGEIGKKFRKAASAEGQPFEAYANAFRSVRMTMGNVKGGEMEAADDVIKYVQGADILKLPADQIPQFAEAAAVLRKQDPSLSRDRAAGLAAMMYQKGMDLSQVSGTMETIQASPDQMAALAAVARLEGQDTNMFMKLTGKIIEAQDLTETVDIGGRKISRLVHPELQGRNPADIIAEGLQGKGDIIQFAGPREVSKLSAMIKRGAYAGALKEAQNSAGILPETDRLQKANKDDFSVGANEKENSETQEAIRKEDEIRRGRETTDRFRRAEQYETMLRKGRTGEMVFSTPGVGKIARLGLLAGDESIFTPLINSAYNDDSGALRIPDAPWKEDWRGAKWREGAEMQSDPAHLRRWQNPGGGSGGGGGTGSMSPDVSVTSPPGTKIHVNIVLENAPPTHNVNTP